MQKVGLVRISPLRPEDIRAVAALHLAGLEYSFNSRLGVEHLAFIYRVMSARPESYVGVALVEGIPAGVVSGALNTQAVKRAMIRSLGFRGWAGMIGRLLLNPSTLLLFAREARHRVPVQGGARVDASLTSLAVSSAQRRKGIATQLVPALEDFFRARGVSSYWLTTPAENTPAREFYRKSGFIEASHSTRTVIMLKQLN